MKDDDVVWVYERRMMLDASRQGWGIEQLCANILELVFSVVWDPTPESVGRKK